MGHAPNQSSANKADLYATASAPEQDRIKVLVIGGPTASGKSGLALLLAERLGGTIINGDSMQLYAELRIITARPTLEDEQRLPHRLYGIVSASERMNVARWRDLVLAEIGLVWQGGRVPIIVGGTGLYLRSLMQGLADIPPIPDAIREATERLRLEIGTPGLHARLALEDVESAASLSPNDTTRVSRAWEVLQATGQSIGVWRRQSAIEANDHFDFKTILVQPARDHLYAACDGRFRTMLDQGALEEVRALAALGLDPALPAMKALGVPELLAYLRDDIDLAAATANAQQATRNYAKRQSTWFRHQLTPDHRIDPAAFADMAAMQKFYVNLSDEIACFISKSS